MEATAEGAITIGVYLGSLYGLLKIIDWVFDQDDVIKEKSRKRLGNWLRNVKIKEPSSDWRDGFVAIFDKWFGEKHLSFKCFFRSLLISIVAYICLWFLMYVIPLGIDILKPVDSELFLDSIFGVRLVESLPYIAVIVVMSIWLNAIPDFLSLFETRILLNFLSQKSGPIRIILILVIDFFLTIGILVLCWSIYDTFNSGRLTINNLWYDLLELNFEKHFVKLSILTTYLTSIWLWLYSLAAILVKLAGKTQSGLHFLKVHLDLENKPFNSIGKVVQLIVVIGYAITGVFILI